MAASGIQPWNKVVRLREEVRTGELSLQEFAADLFDVVMRTGERPLYEDPAKFFSLTYATTSLREIVAATADRLRGKSDRGVRQLELTYGGGKTHTMVTVTHLFRDPAGLPSIPSVNEFRIAMGGDIPQARIAAVCYDKLDLEKGIRTRAPSGEERWLKQPWSVIAFQLAGVEGLRMIHPDGKDEERESPPRDGGPLEEVLSAPAAEGLGTLILFDEVLMYAAEKASHPVSGQNFRTQFVNFLQSLTQAVAKVKTSAMIVSLLASDPTKDNEFGRQLLNEMANVMARKEDESFLPVGRDDVAEVLRRRLLDPATTRDPEAFRPNVGAVVRAIASIDPEFAKTSTKRDERERQYLASFPFDPALMDIFYTKWTSGLPLFQRTRGVLRTFAVALRDAEPWDTSPLAGASILLSKPGDESLSSALRDLADVARVEQVEGASHNWAAILGSELGFARDAQSSHPVLQCREIEQAVVGVFLHSQPQERNHHATVTDLIALSGAGKPDKITLDKGLRQWANRSWYLDEVHLESADKTPDGPGVPKTWRLGSRPNLTQMHDDAKRNRVTAKAIDDALLTAIKEAKWLDAGAKAAGAIVHRLPTVPADVTDDGEFRYVVLGPEGQSESGKPNPLAVRFCEETTDATRPRANRNSIVIVAPWKTGLDVTKDRIRDYLGWLEVKATIGSGGDPIKMSQLADHITTSKNAISTQLRQAYCIVVTRGDDDGVHAFKLTVDTNENLFDTVKKDKKARINETTLAPEALLPDGPYDVWREEEPRRRVRDLVSAFSEQAKLPKMLRRSELLNTVANGAEQGLLVLSLKRPDGTSRTWWRARIDDTALADGDLEVVQNAHAELLSIPTSLVVPGALEGVGSATKLDASDLLAYFAGGKTISVEHEGYTLSQAVPKCSEQVVLASISSAVENGLVWVTNGPASIWKEPVPAGVVNRMASIHPKPDPIPVQEITPEATREAWDGAEATALSFRQALAKKRGVLDLPWPLVVDVIGQALNSRFIEVVVGPTAWPCEAHQAGSVSFRLPAKQAAAGGGHGPEGVPVPPRTPAAPLGQASLDTAALQNLVDALPDISDAAGSLTVRFRIAIEFGEGETATLETQQAIREVLAKISGEFAN